jgi:hypothetical protein
LAGYSGTPLVRKLGITDGARVALLGAPDGFLSSIELPRSVNVCHQLRGRFDVVLFFVTRQRELARRFPSLARAIEPGGGVWIAWPKRSSGVASDLSENPVRAVGIANGLVDNKVCAIDDVWSGLRFVVRVANRAARR